MKWNQILGRTWLFTAGVFRRMLRVVIRPLFAKCGRNVTFHPLDQFSHETISIGDDVFIGSGACFSAKKRINIGNKVMFGPNVSIFAGNHNTSVIGSFMFDVHEKRVDDDMTVVISDDVWVGAGVTILKGCQIGRGAIVAAGAIVIKSVPPYAIVAGIPAKVVRFRWTPGEIQMHEKNLYPETARINHQEIEDLQKSLGAKGLTV